MLRVIPFIDKADSEIPSGEHQCPSLRRLQCEHIVTLRLQAIHDWELLPLFAGALQAITGRLCLVDSCELERVHSLDNLESLIEKGSLVAFILQRMLQITLARSLDPYLLYGNNALRTRGNR